MEKLPLELINLIYSYVGIKPEAKLIKNIIEIYNKDHNYDLTKIYHLYYIKNIMSFSDYFFDVKEDKNSTYEYGDIYW